MADKPQTYTDIWNNQGVLNARCGLDTQSLADLIRDRRQVVPTFDDQISRDLFNRVSDFVADYQLALFAEYAELMDCVLWKHWSTEAKEGRRWELHDKQNARVELIDILFFLNCLAQTVGLSSLQISIEPSAAFSTSAVFSSTDERSVFSSSLCSTGRRLIVLINQSRLELAQFLDANVLPGLAGLLFYQSLTLALFELWRRMAAVLDLGQQGVLDLYHQKWEINMTRTERGHKQVDDPHREADNRSIQ